MQLNRTAASGNAFLYSKRYPNLYFGKNDRTTMPKSRVIRLFL